MLANMALAKGHSSKTKSQVSDIRTHWSSGFFFFFFFFFFFCLLINDINPFRIRTTLLR